MKNRKILALMCIAAMVLSATAVAACGEKNPSGDTSGQISATAYTVRFESNGGSDVDSLSLSAGEKLSAPGAPTRAHYTFDCWCSDAALQNEYTFGGTVSSDLTLYARWTPDKAVKISFVTNGGNEVDEIVAAAGGTVTAPTVPVRTGYEFGGWYTDAALTKSFDFAAAPQDNLVLYAKWNHRAGYSYVTYYVNGEELDVAAVENGKTASVPVLGEGIKADGWFTDAAYAVPYDFSAAVSADLRLYAAAYSEGLTFNGGTVTGYTGAGTDVVIPAVYKGTPITAIGTRAFFNNTSVLSVSLPSSVSEIGDFAFYGCSYLATIDLSSVQLLGQYAFYRNSRLTDFGNIDNVISVDTCAFLGCARITSVTIPAGVAFIGSYAFSDCAALKEIVLPATLSSVEEYAFSGCSSLESIQIPAALTALGTGAFSGCTSLRYVSVAAGNGKFSVSDGNLYTDGGKTLILYLRADKTETNYVSASETEIRAGAFENNDTLTSVEIGAGVTTIGRGAFIGMKKLTSLTLPYLGNGETELFLAYVFGADTAESNGEGGLYVPATLEKVKISSPLTAVPAYAFYGCTGLKTVEGVENAVSYGTNAFSYTAIESFALSASVTSIGEEAGGATAFSGCSALTRLTVASGNARYASFDGCVYSKDLSVLYAVPAGKTGVSFPSSLKTIASYAFSESKIQSVDLPAGLEEIGFAAFYGCDSLTSMRIPFIGGSRTDDTYMLYVFGGKRTSSSSGVQFSDTGVYPANLREIEYYGDADIPDFAFAYCEGLTEVVYGDKPAAIGSYAFYRTALAEFSLGAGITSIGEMAFARTSGLEGEVAVPGRVTYIGAAAFGYNQSITKVSFGEGVTAIPQEAFMPYTAVDGDGNYYYYSSITEIVIPSTVTSIGARAFAYAGSSYDTSAGGQVVSDVALTFAANSALQTIGELAFAYSGISRADLPAAVTSIGSRAFLGCIRLRTVNVGTAETGSRLTSVGGVAFAFCSLTELNIYKTVTTAADVPAILSYNDNGTARTDIFYGGAIPAIRVKNAAVYQAAEYWSAYADGITEIG